MKKSKNNNVILGFGYWVSVDAKERSDVSKLAHGILEEVFGPKGHSEIN